MRPSLFGQCKRCEVFDCLSDASAVGGLKVPKIDGDVLAQSGKQEKPL